MARSYSHSFAEAMALDAHHGTQHHSDAVLFEMLDRIGRRARDELSKPVQRASRPERQGGEVKKTPTRLLIETGLAASASLVMSRSAEAAPALKGPLPRIWTKAEVTEALQDGVLRGRISGTAAAAALNAIAHTR